ncbi:MAG: Tad domain-containing protein [Dehalococcoidia bacterium]|nr:Tad domain-containing protein [Dehalococcoidia bacterium]
MRRRRGSGERGQVIILALLVITVTFVVGAIAVDLTLWLSERRGAQTDADFSALAGAFELLDPDASAGDAIQAATDNLDANDEQLNASLAQPIAVDDSCYDRGVNDAVTVDVRHDSRALFFDIFGVTDPDIGAHAKACAGAVQAPPNLVPFEIWDDPGPCFDTTEKPIFTAMCPIELGAQGDGSDRGILDLDAPDDYCSDGGGSGDIADVIENAAAGICLINENPSAACGSGPWYDCVAVQNGNPKKVLDGVNARVIKDGGCDTGGVPGVDDFFETVILAIDRGSPYNSIYEAKDCDSATAGIQASPRLVSIVVLEEDPPNGLSGAGYPIVAFAGFYIAGCAAEGDPVDDESDLDPDCNAPGIRRLEPTEDLYVAAPGFGPLRAPNACHGGRPPHGVQTSCPPTPSPSPSPTPTPTPTPSPVATDTPSPTPPGPTPTPGPGPSSCGSPGHCVVYGRFVNLIISNADIGTPSDQTTLFGISLVE